MRNDELEFGKVLKDRRGHKLYEGGGVTVDVVARNSVKVRIARATHMNHRWNIPAQELFV